MAERSNRRRWANDLLPGKGVAEDRLDLEDIHKTPSRRTAAFCQVTISQLRGLCNGVLGWEVSETKVRRQHRLGGEGIAGLRRFFYPLPRWSGLNIRYGW